MSQLDYLHGIDLIEIDDSARPVRTVKSSVIGLIGTAGSGPFQEPVLIVGSRRDAVATFGAVRSDGFTIPAALQAIFDQGTATVVVVNVCDPSAHTVDVSGETVVMDGNVGTLVNGHLTSDIIDILDNSIRAYRVGTFTAQPADGDVVSGGGKTYRFKTTPASINDVQIGTDLATSIGNLVAAVNGASGSGTKYYTGTTANTNLTAAGTGTTVTFTAITTTASTGNAIAIGETSTAFSWSGASTTLGNGVLGDGIATTYIVQADATVTLPAGCTIVSQQHNGVDILTADVTLGMRLHISYIANLVENTDFTVDRPTGTFTRILGGKLLPGSTVVVEYTKVSAASLVSADLVGSQSNDDGTYTGSYVFLDAMAKVFVQPRIMVAPGFTHQKPDVVTANPLTAALKVIAERLKGVAIIDCPDTIPADAIAMKEDFADSDRMIFHFPFYRVLAPGNSGSIISVPASAYLAGVMSKTDNDFGFWYSPSNKGVNAILGLSKPIDFALSDPNTIANYLNMNNVSTTIRNDGFLAWGNRTANGKFITRRRIADMIGESIIAASLWAVDQPITKAFVENLVDMVREYLRRLKATGCILGGTAWADPELNTPVVITSGQIYIDYDFSDVTPAEHISYRAHLVDRYVAEIFDTSTAVVGSTFVRA